MWHHIDAVEKGATFLDHPVHIGPMDLCTASCTARCAINPQQIEASGTMGLSNNNIIIIATTMFMVLSP